MAEPKKPTIKFREAQVTPRDGKVFVVVGYEQWWELTSGDNIDDAMSWIREMVAKHLEGSGA